VSPYHSDIAAKFEISQPIMRAALDCRYSTAQRNLRRRAVSRLDQLDAFLDGAIFVRCYVAYIHQ